MDVHDNNQYDHFSKEILRDKLMHFLYHFFSIHSWRTGTKNINLHYFMNRKCTVSGRGNSK